MSDLPSEFIARLSDLGVRVDIDSTTSRPSDLVTTKVRLWRGQSRQEYTLLWGHKVTLSDLGAAGHDFPTMLATTSVSPRSADAFRRAGVQYVDVAGNAWVEFGDVLIDVRGRHSPRVEGGRPHATPSNLFSSARAQVAFTLLAWPELWNAPQREVAEAAGVSLGQANNALSMFRQAGFQPGFGAQRAELLDLWAAAFPTGLAQKLTLAAYSGSVDSLEKLHAEDRVFVAGDVLLSGEVAARGMLRPASLTVYVEHLEPQLPIRNRWRSDGPPNIIVRRKFWTTPNGATHDYDGPLGGLRNAPWPLVYADLLASGDPRVRGVAKEWRERFARPDPKS